MAHIEPPMINTFHGRVIRMNAQMELRDDDFGAEFLAMGGINQSCIVLNRMRVIESAVNCMASNSSIPV